MFSTIAVLFRMFRIIFIANSVLFFLILTKNILPFPLQAVLRELEFKKPQLDELVHTAETLKTDANRVQLQSKGKSL